MMRRVKTLAADLLDTIGLTSSAYNLYSRAGYALDPARRAANEPLRSRFPDGLPAPPPYLVFLVTSSFDLRGFFESGREGAAAIRETLMRNGYDMERFGDVLDFGCGAGRILRHWAGISGPRFHASDYNPRLAGWCRENLAFADCHVNQLAPPLPFEASSMDCVYTISIFTHLMEPLQFAWLDELARVLRPGGLLYLTVHGPSRRDSLGVEDGARFDRGEFVARRSRYEGENLCHVYHPEAYVRETMARGWEIVDYVVGGQRDAKQDVWLLRKPAGRA
jgi:SAM-dependent methyltransferase